ncbi:tagatose-bisphosphate aldolase, partial [Enterococcus faecium]|nr:tagatose-bisphosphate aldolase [Enterococcus faecium]
MLEWSENKRQAMERLSTPEGIITALAIDQRGALKKMMSALGMEATKEKIEQFKTLISQELTPYASAILLDPEYGLPAAQKRAAASGLLLAYEKTGYDQTVPGRLPD